MKEKLGVRGLMVRSSLVKFFFDSEVCMSREGELFFG